MQEFQTAVTTLRPHSRLKMGVETQRPGVSRLLSTRQKVNFRVEMETGYFHRNLCDHMVWSKQCGYHQVNPSDWLITAATNMHSLAIKLKKKRRF